MREETGTHTHNYFTHPVLLVLMNRPQKTDQFTVGKHIEIIKGQTHKVSVKIRTTRKTFKTC